ncbi:glutamate receptor-interacting protein 1 [Elysia marginata]|uniref:Glutamate receptor-interacting protein 1 n=1 Tax=Elysia marginata TaxID=1093978 RepID=A0AAV4FKL5_9GAST|nr:glutamate receptor-interacting protein 1 [Elysia marginata]
MTHVSTSEEERKGTLLVELQKKEGCGLGLTVTGGVDKGQKPQVSNLRPGSIAHRCDSLVVGDHILSVNGIRTGTLRHEEIINLLKNAGTNVTLEVEYEMPESSLPSSNVHCKVHEVTLDKEQSGFGMTLRGGILVETMRAHPLTVVAVRNGGPAHREGSIRPGDHVVAINGYKVTHLSLAETLSLFDQCDQAALFSIAYNVDVQESVESASGPVNVELERTPGTCVGLSLSHSENEGKPCLEVDHVRPMSAADRNGSLRPGDILLSIDGANVENMSVAEALQLLKSGGESHVSLGIVPFTHLERRADRDYLSKNSLSASFSSHTLPVISPSSTILSNMSHHLHHHHQTHYHNNNNSSSNARDIMSTSSTCSERGGPTHSFADSSSVSIGASPFGTLNLRKRSTPSWPTSPHRRATSCMSIASSTAASVLSSTNQVCHAETTEVILFADHKGLGLTLKGGIFSSAPLVEPPIISSVGQRSAAEKCGVLQEGDRVLSVNGVDTIGHTLDEVNRFLLESRPRCVLVTEFDVTESVTPSSGTYIVKLAKKSSDTGITVNSTPCTKSSKDSLFISDVRKGSVAHRTGSVQPGDKLLAINDVRLDTCTSEDAMHLLELPDDIVKLKLKREDPDEGNEGFIIYTVELQRFGGPLGITISGTEDPMDPIVISELTQHGLADRTGAIHVGDRLLAVSGNPTKNKPLSEAIRMLQSAGDIVTLKIARPDPSQEGGHVHLNPFGSASVQTPSKPSTPIPSVDSAVDSWGSSANDVRAATNSWHDIRSRGSSTHDIKTSGDVTSESRPGGYVGAAALPVPQLASFSARPKSSESSSAMEDDYHKTPHDWDTTPKISDDQSKVASRENDRVDNEEQTDASSSSSNMDEWFKTLEEFDMGSGSEMLRQIGLSLRERSSAGQDQHQVRSSRVDAGESPGFSLKQRSKSASRFHQASSASSTLEGVKPRGKPPISKKPDLKSLRAKKPASGNNTIGAAATSNITAVNRHSLTLKTSDSDTDSSSQRPVLPPRSAKTLPAWKSQSMSNGFGSQPPPLPAKPKFSTSSSSDTDPSQSSNGTPKPKDQIQTIFTPSPLQLQRVVLEKKSALDEFGFSLSDALDGCGVYVSNVRSGSLAEDAGLKSYDRVLQVNKTKTKESDCGTVVPLIADTSKRLSLVVCRNPLLPRGDNVVERRAQRAAQSAERESTHGKSRYTLPLGLSAFVTRSSKSAALPEGKGNSAKKD